MLITSKTNIKIKILIIFLSFLYSTSTTKEVLEKRIGILKQISSLIDKENPVVEGKSVKDIHNQILNLVQVWEKMLLLIEKESEFGRVRLPSKAHILTQESLVKEVKALFSNNRNNNMNVLLSSLH